MASKKPDTAVDRLVELFRDGGSRELWRGVRDYLHHNTPVPLYRLSRTGTLAVDGHEIQFWIDGPESLWRAQGHDEIDALSDYLSTVNSSDIVWDIGANLGTYALFGSIVGADVIAFEPGPQARVKLIANAQLNEVADRVDATPYALADNDGQGTLAPAERSGVRQLVDGCGRGDTVPVRRGDGLDLPSPDIIKIDVEGAEIDVLDGMKDRLEAARVCYVEVHDGVERPAVEDRFADAGMTVTNEFDGILRGEAIAE